MTTFLILLFGIGWGILLDRALRSPWVADDPAERTRRLMAYPKSYNRQIVGVRSLYSLGKYEITLECGRRQLNDMRVTPLAQCGRFVACPRCEEAAKHTGERT